MVRKVELRTRISISTSTPLHLSQLLAIMGVKSVTFWARVRVVTVIDIKFSRISQKTSSKSKRAKIPFIIIRTRRTADKLCFHSRSTRIVSQNWDERSVPTDFYGNPGHPVKIHDNPRITGTTWHINISLRKILRQCLYLFDN